jgi:hypothetical protein
MPGTNEDLDEGWMTRAQTTLLPNFSDYISQTHVVHTSLHMGS